MHYLLPFLLVFLLALPAVTFAIQMTPPPLMLAKAYAAEVAIEGYWVSEKFDGVRAYWDGHQLMTRTGRSIPAPKWFTEDFPSFAIEGELWIGYGLFDDISGLIRSTKPNDAAWQRVCFLAFDLPTHKGSFEIRQVELEAQVASYKSAHLKSVGHQRVNSNAELQTMLKSVLKRGGEGLMLNEARARYQPTRSDAILKLKPVMDGEAEVVGYTQGKGKYLGMVGALIVRLPDGREFKIGSGLSDADRAQPPKLHSTVTFQYSGHTSTGLPRFARFFRTYVEF